MPDSTQDTEVDEVLAAIRRLIVEGPAGGRPAAMARLAPLVLTPAQRIDAGADRAASGGPSLRAEPSPASGAASDDAPALAGMSAPLAEPGREAPPTSGPLVLRTDPSPPEPLALPVGSPLEGPSDGASPEPPLLDGVAAPSGLSAPTAEPPGLEPLVLGAEAAPAEPSRPGETSPDSATVFDPEGYPPPAGDNPAASDDPPLGTTMPPTEPLSAADFPPEPLILDSTAAQGPLVLGDPLPLAASPLVLHDLVQVPLAASPEGAAEPDAPEGSEAPGLLGTDDAVADEAEAPGEAGAGADPLPDLRLPWEDPAAQDPLRDPGGAIDQDRLDLGPFAASQGAGFGSAPDASAPPAPEAAEDAAVLAAVLSAGAASAPASAPASADAAPPPADSELRALVAELVREEVNREIAGLRDTIREEVRAALHPSGPG